MSPLLFLVCVAVGGASVVAQESAEEETPSGPWFESVSTPLHLSSQHGAALCRLAWKALRSGQPGERRTGGEGTPRAVFVSWSDGAQTAEVVHGMGIGPVDALRAALGKVPVDKFPGDRLRWLKVDVVQTVLTIPRQVGDELIPGLFARESVLPMPSLFGLAFPQSSGLAFLPEEMVGRSMLDPLGRLSGAAFSSELAREGRLEDMVRWGRLVGLPVSQRVSFFETQAWFYDGNECAPVYRGHRLYDDPTRGEIAAAAVGAAQRLAGMIDRKGQITPPFPQWLSAAEETMRPFDAALAILALSEAAHVADDPAPLVAAAERLAAPIIQGLRRVDKQGTMLCLVEQDEDQQTRGQWLVVRLNTNALAALALCRLASHGDKRRYDVPLGGLARYLLSQYQDGGGFVGERKWLSGKAGALADRSSGGIATCAMVALYEKTDELAFWNTGIGSFRSMLPGAKKTPMGELASDEWFLRAADVCFTYSREPECVVQAQRYALGLVTQQDRHPTFPDMFGAPRRLPSATASASQTGLMAVAARLAFDGGREGAAKEILAECRASLVAQLQGRMGDVETMYLTEPAKYTGMFRDHVRGYGFDLQSQYVQILSLCELAKAMKHVGMERLRDDALAASRKIDEELHAVRAKLEQYPALLDKFDGRLERHTIAQPERRPGRATERTGERGGERRAPIAPTGDWDVSRPATGGRGRPAPVVRPVQPRR